MRKTYVSDLCLMSVSVFNDFFSGVFDFESIHYAAQAGLKLYVDRHGTPDPPASASKC